MSDADMLRRAGERLREVAGKATPGPWFAEPALDDPRYLDLTHPTTLPNGWTGNESFVRWHYEGPPLLASDAEYVATMQPVVALALAEWIEAHAADLARVDRITQTDSPPDTQRALAVARVVLGEESCANGPYACHDLGDGKVTHYPPCPVAVLGEEGP